MREDAVQQPSINIVIIVLVNTRQDDEENLRTGNIDAFWVHLYLHLELCSCDGAHINYVRCLQVEWLFGSMWQIQIKQCFFFFVFFSLNTQVYAESWFGLCCHLVAQTLSVESQIRICMWKEEAFNRRCHQICTGRDDWEDICR